MDDPDDLEQLVEGLRIEGLHFKQLDDSARDLIGN